MSDQHISEYSKYIKNLILS